MSDWHEFGSSLSGNGEWWSFERDSQKPGRFRITYTRDGESDNVVRHTFDMADRWDKRFGQERESERSDG